MEKRTLIVGGTSGLGLELAKACTQRGYTVTVTGRTDPKLPSATFVPFNISGDANTVNEDINSLVGDIGQIDALFYAAGFYQEGSIDALQFDEIATMMNVGLLAPALLVSRLKAALSTKLDVMFITSSSQYTPREKEPVYTAVKSGLGMLGASLALAREIGKVLVVAPSGMKTPFWDGQSQDTSKMLSPEWVTQRVIELWSGHFKYRYAKILREPPSVEIVGEKI